MDIKSLFSLFFDGEYLVETSQFEHFVYQFADVAHHAAVADDGGDAAFVEQVLGVFPIPFQLQVYPVAEQTQVQADIADISGFPAEAGVGRIALSVTHQAAVIVGGPIGVGAVSRAGIHTGVTAVAITALDFQPVDEGNVEERLVMDVPGQTDGREVSPAGIGAESGVALAPVGGGQVITVVVGIAQRTQIGEGS